MHTDFSGWLGFCGFIVLPSLFGIAMLGLATYY